MGSDAGDPQQKFEGYKGFYICINTKDPAQAEKVFNALSEQASRIIMPLAKTSWAEKFGQLADRYGVEWMVNCDTQA
jgi:PhnB protein